MAGTEIKSKAVHFLSLSFLLSSLTGCIIKVDTDDWDWDVDHHQHHEAVNGDIEVREGEQTGDIELVNGGVVLNEGSIAGNVEVVNGTVKLYADVQVESINATNGSIRGKENLQVIHDVGTVNGTIRLDEGTEVGTGVSSINGTIRLQGTQVSQNVTTVNGDIRLLDNTHVLGDVIFERSDRSRWGNPSKPVLEIDSTSSVAGTIHLHRDVQLRIDDKAKVNKIVQHN